MNNDLISREALKEEINKRLIYGENGNDNSNDVQFTYAKVRKLINNAPTVEINTNEIEYKAYCKGLEDGKKIARPQGEWLSDRCGHFYKCSICGREIETEAFENPEWNYPFCHCGADMRKGGVE